LLDDKIQQSAALRELVEIGPEALPFLLDALDDRTPTKHTVRYGGMFGGRMPLGNELHPNPVNPIETGVLSKRKSPRRDFPEASINHYTVKVGDVCFEALGQIMGRGYQAVRYQAVRHALRGDIVINSPTRDAKLCAEVRAIWASKDPARRLLDSLLTDYATEGVWNGHSLDDWDDGSNLQVESALRLLYYFPLETVPLIAARLRSFDVVVKKDDPGDDEWTRRQVRNGVRTDEFIEAVAWCRSREPVIQEALAEIAKRTNDPGIREALGRKTEEQTKP